MPVPPKISSCYKCKSSQVTYIYIDSYMANPDPEYSGFIYHTTGLTGFRGQWDEHGYCKNNTGGDLDLEREIPDTSPEEDFEGALIQYFKSKCDCGAKYDTYKTHYSWCISLKTGL